MNTKCAHSYLNILYPILTPSQFKPWVTSARNGTISPNCGTILLMLGLVSGLGKKIIQFHNGEPQTGTVPQEGAPNRHSATTGRNYSSSSTGSPVLELGCCQNDVQHVPVLRPPAATIVAMNFLSKLKSKRQLHFTELF